MAIFKSLGPDDISRIPFNANKQFSFTSSSASTAGFTIQTFEYSTSVLDTISSASTDTQNTLKYYQLDHLFYKNYRLDISNKLGDADYLAGPRILYNKVNVLSIPSNLYGNNINPGTFVFTGSNDITVIDDKKGNLFVEGTKFNEYITDERKKVFFVGPVKGFKQYNLNYDLYGKTNPNSESYYNKDNIYDDSYYFNLLNYKNILFKEEEHNTKCKVPSLSFNSNVNITSSITAPHSEIYNFNPNEDFTISAFINPAEANGYILCKSTTQTVIPTPIYQQSLNTTGSSQTLDLKSKLQFPFEIFIDSDQNLTFRRSDGTFTPTISASIDTGSLSHIACMNSASQMEIWINGTKIASGSDTTIYRTENQANLYIGTKGETSNFYSGSISNLKIFNTGLKGTKSSHQITRLSSSINGSPYVGNIFYSNGLAAATHPNHQEIFSGSIGQIKFKNVFPIYENEYMCTVKADEYNYTHNISARKTPTTQHPDLANFATGSLWKPYVTTIGLYNENNELLVIGKLGQPVKMSEETDTTFMIRWDT